MTNYKKIYNKLICEIKDELIAYDNALCKRKDTNILSLNNEEIIDTIENKHAICVLNWILSLLPEIEGKECHRILMDEKEFKQWKKKIKR